MNLLDSSTKIRFPYGRPKAEGQDVLWRIDDRVYSVVLDAESERYGTSDPHIEAQWFPVVKRTKRGAWINVWGSRKFVRVDARKRWACPSLDEAVASFLARKRRQEAIHLSVARRARFCIDALWSVDQRTKIA